MMLRQEKKVQVEDSLPKIPVSSGFPYKCTFRFLNMPIGVASRASVNNLDLNTPPEAHMQKACLQCCYVQRCWVVKNNLAALLEA